MIKIIGIIKNIYRINHGTTKANATIIMVPYVNIFEECRSIPFLFSVFLSIIVLYNWPPSNGPIGKALKIATLKLMNHIQNRRFAGIAKYDPKIGDEYLS